MTTIEKQNLFCRLVARFIPLAQSAGYLVTFGECFRPQPMVDWYAARGMGIKKSLHPLRLAIDLNFFKNGLLLSSVDEVRELGEMWKALSVPEEGIVCCWGGDFEPKPDSDHFSLEHQGIR